MTSVILRKQSTSLAKSLYTEGINLSIISSKLAGLSPSSFDKEVKPLRKYLEQFDTEGEVTQLLLVDNITNHLIDGLYVRELLIPKHAIILSRVHKRSLINIISKGSVVVIDSLGQNVYTAPHTFISSAGTQRVVIALEETVWNTAHITKVTNPDELVDDLTFDNYDEFIKYTNILPIKEE